MENNKFKETIEGMFITETLDGLPFAYVLESLRLNTGLKNRKFRRKFWREEPGKFLTILEPYLNEEFIIQEKTTMTGTLQTALMLRTTRNGLRLAPWIPDFEDLLATDWEEIID